MRALNLVLGPLVPLLVWSLLWWALGKPEMVLAGTIFTVFVVGVWILQTRLEGPEWSTVRNVGTAGGLVLGLCLAVLASNALTTTRTANPLAGELDPLTYGSFEVVGLIQSCDVLPVSSPLEYEDWEQPLLVTVSGEGGYFEFICDGFELRDRLERGRTIKATGQLEGRDEMSSTPVAEWVEILD